MKRITDHSAAERFWQAWLNGHIPEPLRSRICRIIEREGTLTIFAESAAWSARLRYAVLELEREMRAVAPELAAIRVRVLPRR